MDGAQVQRADRHGEICGAIALCWLWAQGVRPMALPARQRLVRVNEAVVARSMDFRFLVPTVGLGVVAKAGTPIAQDGDKVWAAPYDDTVLVMPTTEHLRPGNTQVRLGRYDPA